MEREILSNCLAGNVVNSSCTQITIDIPEYDIKKGDSLDWALTQITSKNLETEATDASESPDLSCLGGNGNSLCASKIVYRGVELSITGNSVAWNMDSIAQELPEDYNITYGRASINSPNLNIPVYDGKGLTGTTEITLDLLPITIDLQIRIESPCGQLLMKTSKVVSTLSNESELDTLLMSVDYFGNESSSFLGQTEVNELLIQQICRLTSRLNTLEQENIRLRNNQ